MQTVNRSRTNLFGWLTLIGCLAGFFLWQIGRIHVFEFSNDEGIVLMWTRMARAGYPLYVQTVADQPPGLMMLLMGAFSLFGESVLVARVLSLTLAILGLIGVALIARELGGWGAAIASVFLLSVSPMFYWYCLAVMQDVPAFSLAAMALALSLIYGRSRTLTWLWLSGLAFGLSLVIKLITLPLLAPIGLTIVAGNVRRGRIGVWRALLDGLIWAGGAIPPVGLTLLAFEISAMMPQVLGAIGEARGAYPWSSTENLMRFRDLVLEGHWGLIALAAVGLMAVSGRPMTLAWTVLTWTVVATATLFIHVPLWSHHLVMVLMPVAVLAGAGTSALANGIWAWRSGQRGDWGSVQLVLSLLAVVAYLASLPTIVRLNSREPSRFEPVKWEALARLREFTAAGDFAVSDMGMMVFRAGLLSPPTVVDLGEKRIKSGLLTDRDVLEATLRYPVRAVVFWSSRQYLIPDYLAWVDHTYQHVFQDGRSRHIYLPYEGGPVVHYGQPNHLDDGVSLVGYSLAKPTVRAGETIQLTLFWEAREHVGGDYKVFTHLVDDQGRRWGQKDNVPGGGDHPTSAWRPGALVVDTYNIPVDPQAPSGSYQLQVGMYEPVSGRRLRVLDAAGQPSGDHILLGSVKVQ